MAKKLRLPLLIAAVVIVALLLPGPATIAGPDLPRPTGHFSTTSFVDGSPGVKMRYAVYEDQKKWPGMVTFTGRASNTQTKWEVKVGLTAKIPDGTTLVESWCSTPGTYPADGPDKNGWITWSIVKRGALGPEGSTNVCGFTVSGWDGKRTLTTGWRAYWAGTVPGSSGGVPGDWEAGPDGRQHDAAVTVNYPFDQGGYFRAVGIDAGFLAPTRATVQALEARVAALERGGARTGGMVDEE